MNGRERVFAMIDGREPDHLPAMPITMMFAADTAGVNYTDYARDHRVLAEAQLRTAETYGFDYVSVISDPAREASDLGATIEWFDNQPPAIVESRALLTDKSALAGLRPPDPLIAPRMSDRVAGVRRLKERGGNDLAVEGWVEGPIAMAADLRGVNTLMLDFTDDPAFVRDLMDFVVGMELSFARAQIEAGADLIGIGDAAASLVGPRRYVEFDVPWSHRLIDGIHAAGARVRLHICGNTRRILKDMGRYGADIVDLDFLTPLDEGRAAMGPKQVLLGNIDPVRVLRDGTPESVRAAIAECHRHAGPRYIVGAGCEVPRGTPPENVRAMVSYAMTSAPDAAPER
jgi:MtaA/CmuA family methyltransferase